MISGEIRGHSSRHSEEPSQCLAEALSGRRGLCEKWTVKSDSLMYVPAEERGLLLSLVIVSVGCLSRHVLLGSPQDPIW